MRRAALFLSFLFASIAFSTCREGSVPPSSSSPPVRLPRRDAFFGLHFDLHPNETDNALGEDVTEEMVGSLLDRVKPDYVQYDCKGHAGWAGYPTKVGWAAPGIKKDSLAVWRKATKERGVGLYIHYSGVWDSRAIAAHPDWARVDEKGRRDPNATSVFGPYVDELLIPQLKEVAEAYDLDGLWVDGECWAAQFDYSPRALAAWKEETGLAAAPEGKSDPGWLRWKNFHRRAFEDYLVRWVDALHAARPGLQVTSNWMYSSFAPKPAAARLDFLSGDYSWSLSVDRARVEARYLASTGMPWDLMAWGFTKTKDLGWTLKTPVKLMQEAAVVLMQGGGFQVYNTPTRTGFIPEAIVGQEARVAEFCRARQAASFKSTTVPQVALLLSAESHWEKSDRVFAPWGGEFDGLEGALHALLELGYSVDVLAEHQLEPRLGEFPLVVVPDSPKLEEGFRQALLEYAEAGGSLLLMGEKCARLFGGAAGVEFEGEAKEAGAELDTQGGPVSVGGVWQEVRLVRARPAGMRHPTRDTRKDDGKVAASIAEAGKGKIAAFYGPLADIFFRNHHPWLRQYIGAIVKDLFPNPAVTVTGPAYVDAALRKTADGQLSLHLLNRTNLPMPDRYEFTDFIPAVGPVEVEMKCPARPKGVRLVPEAEGGGAALKWTWKAGRLRLTVPRLEIHNIVVVDE